MKMLDQMVSKFPWRDTLMLEKFRKLLGVL